MASDYRDKIIVLICHLAGTTHWTIIFKLALNFYVRIMQNIYLAEYEFICQLNYFNVEVNKV